MIFITILKANAYSKEGKIMAENSLVLEKERLAQELSIGYKYFGNLHKTEELYKKGEGGVFSKKN